MRFAANTTLAPAKGDEISNFNASKTFLSVYKTIRTSNRSFSLFNNFWQILLTRFRLQKTCLDMWKRRLNMICSLINSGNYHIHTVSLVFLPFSKFRRRNVQHTLFWPDWAPHIDTSPYIIPRFISNQLPLSTTLWRPVQPPSTHQQRTTPSLSNTAIYAMSLL